MVRSIQVQLGTQDGDWRNMSLRNLADRVVPNDEAGQRGKKLSRMMQMLADAYSANSTETTRLMKQIIAQPRKVGRPLKGENNAIKKDI